jgi:hypothetical protein
VHLKTVDTIDRISVRILKESNGKYMCQIKDDKIIISNNKTNTIRELVFHKNTIRDITYLNNIQCFVFCSEGNIVGFFEYGKW